MALSGRRLPCQRLPLARASLHSAKFKPGGLRGGGMRITNVPIVAQPPRPETAEAATCRSCCCFLLVIGWLLQRHRDWHRQCIPASWAGRRRRRQRRFWKEIAVRQYRAQYVRYMFVRWHPSRM
jgi:hypothetical protein